MKGNPQNNFVDSCHRQEEGTIDGFEMRANQNKHHPYSQNNKFIDFKSSLLSLDSTAGQRVNIDGDYGRNKFKIMSQQEDQDQKANRMIEMDFFQQTQSLTTTLKQSQEIPSQMKMIKFAREAERQSMLQQSFKQHFDHFNLQLPEGYNKNFKVIRKNVMSQRNQVAMSLDLTRRSEKANQELRSAHFKNNRMMKLRSQHQTSQQKQLEDALKSIRKLDAIQYTQRRQQGQRGSLSKSHNISILQTNKRSHQLPSIGPIQSLLGSQDSIFESNMKRSENFDIHDSVGVYDSSLRNSRIMSSEEARYHRVFNMAQAFSDIKKECTSLLINKNDPNGPNKINEKKTSNNLNNRYSRYETQPDEKTIPDLSLIKKEDLVQQEHSQEEAEQEQTHQHIKRDISKIYTQYCQVDRAKHKLYLNKYNTQEVSQKQDIEQVVDQAIKLMSDRQINKITSIQNSKNSQIDFIRNVPIDSSRISQNTAKKITTFKNRLHSNPADLGIIMIQNKEKNYQFKDTWRKNKEIYTESTYNKELKKHIQNAKTDTKEFLNNILYEHRKDVQQQNSTQNHSFQQVHKNLTILNEVIKRDHDQEGDEMHHHHHCDHNNLDLTKQESSDARISIINQVLEMMSPAGVFKKRQVSRGLTKMQVMLDKFQLGFKNKVSEQMILLDEKEFSKQIQQFERVLKTMAGHDESIGYKYKLNNVNMFANKYLISLQSKFNVNNLKIDLNIRPNLERQQEAKYTLDNIFQNQVVANEFYTKAKQGKLFSVDDPKEQAFFNFFNEINKGHNIAQPLFCKKPVVSLNQIYLNEIKVNTSYAQAIRMFLRDSQNFPEFHCKLLFLNNCDLSDDDVAQILQGIVEQGSHLQSLTILNNTFGPNSLKVFDQAMTNLISLHFSKLQGLNKQLLIDILKSLDENGKNIMELKLTNINLNFPQCIQYLCEFISNSTILNSIDLSWCNLSSKNLNKIMEVLNKQHSEIINLNLSYNSLSFKTDYEEESPSIEFIDKLIEFIEASKSITHLNFSGMLIEFSQLMRLGQKISEKQSMRSVHLSDNELGLNQENMLDLLNLFGIRQTFIENVQLQCKNFMINNPVKQPRILKEVVKKICKDMEAKEEIVDYIKLMVKYKQNQEALEDKRLTQTELATGIGKADDNQVDKLVITKKCDHPELVFNQHHQIDRYYSEDSQQKWKISKGNQCFVCEKHQYTLIFYKQSRNFQINEQLHRISGKNTVSKIEEYLNLNPSDKSKSQPIICGTVVEDRDFVRKLKMIRADLFATLILSQNGEVLENQAEATIIKESVIQLARKNQKFLPPEVSNYISKGWQEIISDLCFQNTQEDVTTINLTPNWLNCDDDIEDIYVYASYLPPGHHSFLLFDPYLHLAFGCQFTVQKNKFQLRNHNKQLKLNEFKKPIPNVWRTFRIDSHKDYKDALAFDIQGDKLNLSFIKDTDKHKQIISFLEDKFGDFIVFFMEMQCKGFRYPLIHSEPMRQSIMEKIDDKLLPRSYIDIKYQEATRTQMKPGLSSHVNRAEMFEFFLRCVNEYCQRKITMEAIELFYSKIVEPVASTSRIMPARQAIRADKTLNCFLYLNMEPLKMLYNLFRKNRPFTIETAFEMFCSTELDENIQMDDVRRAFIVSKMSVLNEQKDSNKYNEMVYVEFQELISRLSDKIVSLESHTKTTGKIKLSGIQIYSQQPTSSQVSDNRSSIGSDKDFEHHHFHEVLELSVKLEELIMRLIDFVVKKQLLGPKEIKKLELVEVHEHKFDFQDEEEWHQGPATQQKLNELMV